MKHALLDSNGFPTAFYDVEIHGENIPQNAVKITDSEWKEFINNHGRRRWDGEGVVEYTPPPPPLNLHALAADLRWQKEVGGIEVAGVAINTDDRSKLMIAGLRIAAEANPTAVTKWKAPSGWIELSAPQVIAISNAALAHVAACFALEAQVVEAIEAGTLTTAAQIEAAFAERASL